LYPILLYGPAVKMADDIAGLDAKGVFDYISDLLKIDLTVAGLEHVPKDGPVLIASTHPTGIPDGAAMYDALKDVRPDMTFFANRDAIRAAPGIEDMIIPVVWRPEERTRLASRETLVEARKAFEADRCVVLFPSGRLAYMDENKKLTEQDWLGSVASFARKYDCPVVPAHIEMRNSWLYYWFWRVNTELRDITLFHELLNKKNKPYRITFGAPINADALQGNPTEAAEALRLKAMALNPDGASYMAAPTPAASL
jgi:putative hemolysin